MNNAQNFITIAGTNLFMDLTIIASITVAIFYMNWQRAIIAYATLPVYVVLQKRVSKRMRQKAREARRRMDAVEGNLHEAIAGIAEVKSFTHEPQQMHRFVSRSRGFLAAVSENIRTYPLLLGSTTWLTRLTLVIVIWAGGHYVLRNTLTVGGLMAFYAYLEMLYTSLNRLGELNIELANSRAAIDRLFEFFDCKPEAQNASAPPLTLRGGQIDYEEVFSGYAADHPLFQGLCLHIPPGGG